MINLAAGKNVSTLISRDTTLEKLNDLLNAYHMDLNDLDINVKYNLKTHYIEHITFNNKKLSGCLVKIVVGLLDICETTTQYCYDFEVDTWKDTMHKIYITLKPIYKNK